ncbi:MAG: ribonuclease P protein component [Armatimonadetes bacterium]|nr:ribonuclease P protein component [Armatimonadota bacterium]
MLPKAHRLRRSRDFREAFARGRSFNLPPLRVVVRGTGTGTARIGFVASKKVGGAVERNRVKRRLRDACRQLVGTWRPGFDVVFVARALLREMPFEAVLATVAELGERAGLADAGRGSGGSVRRSEPGEAPPCGGCVSA